MLPQDSGLLVIVSQGQSRSPEKRALEEGIATYAASLPNAASLVVPHLYDLASDSQSLHRIRTWQGPIVVIAWLFDRASHWILDRMDIRGKVGAVELIHADSAIEDEDESDDKIDDRSEIRVANLAPRQDRRIYSIDFKAAAELASFQNEISRIHQIEEFDDQKRSRETLTLDRLLTPGNSTSLALDGSGALSQPASLLSSIEKLPNRIEEHPSRRWYPVIDYSRCTNCMECIDFCLFGVYGVDRGETILVEQPDNCRKGCPACSRVCPENAIIFPQHKSPAIAGAPVESGEAFKIDLSKLFGAPDRNEDAATTAARERDEQLILAGRAAVGGESNPRAAATEGAAVVDRTVKDNLDNLLDELDSLDL